MTIEDLETRRFTVRVERLNEPVKVRANFGGGIVTPLLFQRGVDTLSCTVPSGDVYELFLNSHDLTWRLTSVMLDG
jgi:hypothetical protein